MDEDEPITAEQWLALLDRVDRRERKLALRLAAEMYEAQLPGRGRPPDPQVTEMTEVAAGLRGMGMTWQEVNNRMKELYGIVVEYDHWKTMVRRAKKSGTLRPNLLAMFHGTKID
jgi:hypothetical protein